MDRVEQVELYAYVGEDELGSGQIGLKQGFVPAGLIPLVAVSRHRWKMEREFPQMEEQAARYGKKIYLCRFVFAEVIRSTIHGD